MKQILHIFRKDSRHFLPEILISLVILALYVVHYPSAWRFYADPRRRQMLAQITAALGILMPVSWGLLIARVTYAETLVGDNEFWITRPYEWKKLLASKVLFLGLWIGMPYLLAQAYMLVTAGFHPTSYLPGLLVDLFFLSAILILPLFSIAAVNANFARMTLTLLGILFLYIAIMFFATMSVGDSTFNPYRDVVVLPLVFCICAAAIFLQYATRRVWLSRALLLALPVLVLSVAYAYSRPSLVGRAYPRPNSAAPPVLIALAPDANHPIKARSSRGQDYIDLWIQYSGVPEGYAVFSDNVQFTLIAADGQQWTSPWQGNDDHILPGVHHAELSLALSPAVYDRFKSGPVTLRITSALTRLQAGMVTAIGYPSSDVPVAGIGFCSAAPKSGWDLRCRSAVSDPNLTRVTALWSKALCSGPPPPPEDTLLGSTWIGLHPGPIESVLSPVLTQNIDFSNSRVRNRYDGSDDSWHLCPGTPLTFTQYNVADRTQSDITIPDFHLPVVQSDR